MDLYRSQVTFHGYNSYSEEPLNRHRTKVNTLFNVARGQPCMVCFGTDASVPKTTTRHHMTAAFVCEGLINLSYSRFLILYHHLPLWEHTPSTSHIHRSPHRNSAIHKGGPQPCTDRQVLSALPYSRSRNSRMRVWLPDANPASYLHPVWRTGISQSYSSLRPRGDWISCGQPKGLRLWIPVHPPLGG
jgi:hypothetical protein